MTATNSNLKWKIHEYKNRYFVTKKYFNLFWYSFDWKALGEYFFSILFFIALCSVIIAIPLAFLISITFIKCFFWTCGFFTLLLTLINRREFKSYAEAEAYIKQELQEELKINITEITWDGQKISIEKKTE